MTERRLPFWQRWISMFLDLALMALIANVLVLLPALLFYLVTRIDLYSSGFSPWAFLPQVMVVAGKDSFGGRSPAKRILGQQLVVKGTAEKVCAGRGFARNLTAPIWFVELICLAIKPSRRLGDRIAGTEVISRETFLARQRAVSFDFESPEGTVIADSR